MQRSENEVRTADGRLLLVEVAGPEHGDVVFWHHGTPGSRYRDEVDLEEGAARGLRHVSYSRPGYEGSDRHPDRRIADCASDLRTIVDWLELGSGFVVGESGGGPHALAHAALLPAWVRGVAVVSGTAPLDAEGLDWPDGMAKENLEEFDAMMASDAAGLKYLEDFTRPIKAAKNVRELSEALGGLVTDADRESQEAGGLDDYLTLVWRRLAASSLWGWFDDDKALCGDWGFDLGRVEAPVTLWHGEVDPAAPPAHGRWLADHVPDGKLCLVPGVGHGLIAESYGAILDDLVASGPDTSPPATIAG